MSPPVTFSIAGLALGAALLSSCALVLGFDDHEPYPTGTTTSGSGGSGSAGGAGGAGTTGGTGGAGGSIPPAHFGTPEVIASGQAGPSDINLDGTTVYWVNTGLAAGQAEIMRLPKSGGTPAQVAFSQSILHGLVLDATNAWSAEHNTNGGVSYIAGFGKGGSSSVPIGYGLYVGDGATYSAIALQGTVIAWSSNESSGSIFRGDTQNSAKSTVATTQGQVNSIALDGTVTYWASSAQGAILRESGGTVEVLAGGQSSPTDVVLDADDAYWTGNDGTVKKLAKTSPGGQPTLIAGDALSPQGIALDAGNVYWAESDGTSGRVRTAPKGGGKVETIATGQYPFAVAVDDGAVYVTMQGDGTVVRIPKK